MVKKRKAMKDIIPCFVRVQNDGEHQELTDYMTSVGYKNIYLMPADDGIYISARPPKGNKKDGVDCGTNIELFKALAAINDKTIVNQWHIAHCPLLFKKLKGFVETVDNKRYVSAGGWFRPLKEHLNFKFRCFSVPDELFHKATASEIVERYTQNQP
jgi:hypothetical protein